MNELFCKIQTATLKFLDKNVSKIDDEGVFKVINVLKVLHEFLILNCPTIRIMGF